ncbi:lysostaphin resistance A-like protein [Actinoplanes sp. NPDC051494]|uniref:lysostaphin resistance A-like protein n=1 Tax=Actinoplanes sp. NPDC051494 TaxID=3363907 RepID=UPI0037AAC391
MLMGPAPLSPYHRLVRPSWWRMVLGALFIVVAGAVLGFAGYAAGTAAVPGARGEMAGGFLTVAGFLPATVLAAWWIQRRRPGTLSSVTGRLRWRWLLACLPVAAGTVTLLMAAAMLLPGETTAQDRLAGWGPFALSMLVLLVVVPPQAAAEEYLMRGWLLQGLGGWFRGPWVPIVVQAVAFAALHGWGTPWGFADLVVFGLVAGLLTVRTGGLEAAIALHVANNLLGSVIVAAYGDLGTDETAADMPWQAVAVDVPLLIAYAVVVLWLARRRGLSVTSPGAPIVPAGYSPPPAGRPVHTG